MLMLMFKDEMVAVHIIISLIMFVTMVSSCVTATLRIYIIHTNRLALFQAVTQIV